MARNSTIREVEKLEAAMEVDPPVIMRELDRQRRVMVAVFIQDRHADHPNHNPMKPRKTA